MSVLIQGGSVGGPARCAEGQDIECGAGRCCATIQRCCEGDDLGLERVEELACGQCCGVHARGGCVLFFVGKVLMMRRTGLGVVVGTWLFRGKCDVSRREEV